MTITLTPKQQEWVQAHVESGDFASVEEAVRQLPDERIFELEIAEDDMMWAKPLVDEGLAALGRGDVITLEEHRSRMDARIAALKD